MQDLILQDHKENVLKTCSRCKKDARHIVSKHILQPPNYLIIAVNRVISVNNTIMKSKSIIPLDLNINLGPYKFSLQVTIDHHGNSLHCGHYTASVNCCGKTFYCNDNRITECDIINTRNSSTAFILQYKLIEERP